MTLVLAVRLLCLLAAGLSLVLARRRTGPRPVAAFLVTVAAVNVARGLLRHAVPALDLPRVPASVPRLALWLDQALYLAWPAAIAALALGVCFSRRSWPAVAAWAVAMLALAGCALRAELAAELYGFTEIAALAFAGGAIVQWSGRDKVPRLPQIALVIVVVFDGLALLLTRANVAALWPSALVCYLALFAALVVVQGGALCLRSK